jgi:tRNA pseudouridine55 synthase
VPPMVSALKVDGKRLHELAREGVEIEREPRPVTIHRFDVEPTDDPLVYRIVVTCSSGTYIRSLADDLGRLLGGGAHLRELRRTACGSFTDAVAASPDDAPLLSPADALRDYPCVQLDAATVALVRNGRKLARDERWTGDGPWAVTGPDGELVAVYEPAGALEVKPDVVLPAGE